MIVDQESYLRKSQLDPESNLPVATSSTRLIPHESPPVYTPRDDSGPSSSSLPPYSHPSSAPLTQKRIPNRAKRRFFNALVLAFCLYSAIVLVFRSLFFWIRGPPPHDRRIIVGHPEPEDGKILDCIIGGDYPWPPSTPVRFPSFNIPLNSSAISVLARGKQATGSVTVELDQTSGNEEITVDIAARYHDWDLLRGTTVCLMEKEEGELGVGVFTPNRLTWTNRRTEFEITVRIPHQPASRVVKLPKLEILAPNFGVTFPGADNLVHLHNLTIHTSGMPVLVGSVKATSIDIRTSNARIHGTFFTNSSLTLKTSNSPITANIFLESDCKSVVETSAHSTPINDSLTGGATSLSNTDAPQYTIRAATANAGLNLSFIQPPDSCRPPSPPTLDIVGTTSNGPAELLLQLPFEGSFYVSTSPSSHAQFVTPPHGPERDPLGLGRQQKVEFTTDTKSRKGGRAYWGDLDDERELGRIELSTSNGPASLRTQ